MQVAEIGRDDAALVYRHLRDVGPADVVTLAEICFPLTFGSADPLYPRLIKRSVERVLESVLYLRGHGVTVNLSHGEVSLFEVISSP